MIRLAAAEWLKMRHRWMPRILTLVMLAIVALLFWGNGAQSDRIDVIMPRAWISAVSFAGIVSLFLWPILGGSWSGNEYGWGTVRLVLSRRPSRAQWTLAALAILALTVGLALLAAVIAGSIAGMVVASLTHHSAFETAGLPADYPVIALKAFLGTWYVLVLYVAVGYAAGSIFRSSAMGVGIGIGFTFAQLIAFGIFLRLGGLWKTAALHFPYTYANALTTRLTADASAGTPGPDTPGVGPSLIGITVYLAILIGITLYLTQARDVTS